ncbi:MAG: hypothetical protein COA79_00345 [Planctomycetota bacterium]|nr:MAG: hypothetical protein COA79_00345 [Planctomycetota bacterium]
MYNKILFFLSTTLISVGFQVSLGLMSSIFASENKENISTISLIILQISMCAGCLYCHKFIKIESSKKVMIYSALFLGFFVLCSCLGGEIVFYVFSVLGGVANGFFSLAFLTYMNLICRRQNLSLFINLIFASHLLGIFITFITIRIIMPYISMQIIIFTLFIFIVLGVGIACKFSDIRKPDLKKLIQENKKVDNFKMHLILLLCISVLIGYMMGLNFSMIPIKITNLLGKEVWAEICSINTIVFFVLLLVFCKFKIIAKVGVGLSGLFLSFSIYLFSQAVSYWDFVIMEIVLTFGVAFYWGSVIQISNLLFRHYFDYVNGPRTAVIFLASSLGISIQFFYSELLFVVLSFVFSIIGILGGLYLSYQVLYIDEVKIEHDDDYQILLD